MPNVVARLVKKIDNYERSLIMQTNSDYQEFFQSWGSGLSIKNPLNDREAPTIINIELPAHPLNSVDDFKRSSSIPTKARTFLGKKKEAACTTVEGPILDGALQVRLRVELAMILPTS